MALLWPSEPFCTCWSGTVVGTYTAEGVPDVTTTTVVTATDPFASVVEDCAVTVEGGGVDVLRTDVVLGVVGVAVVLEDGVDEDTGVLVVSGLLSLLVHDANRVCVAALLTSVTVTTNGTWMVVCPPATNYF